MENSMYTLLTVEDATPITSKAKSGIGRLSRIVVRSLMSSVAHPRVET